MTVIALATLNVWIFSRDRSRIGQRRRLQRQMTAAPSPSAAVRQPRIRGLPQPQSWPLTTLSTSVPIAAANSSVPGRSGTRRRPGARLSASCWRASRIAATPIGTLTRNTRRQFAAATSSPPSEGPNPAAAALTADSKATACERRAGGNAFSTSARAEGTRQAAPSAWMTRKAISVSADGAMAHSSEPAVNSARPKMNTRRRPSTSASPAAAIKNAANTML